MSQVAVELSPDRLALLSRVAKDIAHARRLSPDDVPDFVQSVQVRLLERNYDVLRQFQGRCALRTYLTVVVDRLLLDWRNSVYGKWRPSAAARRMGERAIRLEQLIQRDGFSTHEAVQMLLAEGAPESLGVLHGLAERLPVRHKRQMVQDGVLRNWPGVPFQDPIDARERRRRRHEACLALRTAVAQLPEQDRRLILARYHHGRRMHAVADELRTDPKILYRRVDRVLRSLRKRLVAAGVTASAIDAGAN